jgi:predicted transcriptional regulator
MLARDIMSSPVISAAPSQLVSEIARLLRDQRIGGMPVIENGKLVGMITESDLIHRHEIGTQDIRDLRPWWQRLRQRDASIRAYVKSHGRTARHVMSTDIRVVEDTEELSRVAAVFDINHIGRVPVVRGGQVVGIIARADLVQALARQALPRQCTGGMDDEAIRQRLLSELSGQDWWNGALSNVYVSGGIVVLKGVVETPAHRLGARVAAENLPGVRGVQDDRILSSEMSGIF